MNNKYDIIIKVCEAIAYISLGFVLGVIVGYNSLQ